MKIGNIALVDIFQRLGEGFLTTLLIFSLTLALSIPLGLIVYFGKKSRFKPLSWLVNIYISIMRGTPLMLQLIVVCYGPYYLFGLRINSSWSFMALIIGFVINYAAYFAEIFRAGIESIPTGQYEAAEVLGYSKPKTFFKIILPQMVKRVIPPVTNEVITLVKDTSLGFVLSYMEMFTIAKQLASTVSNITPLMIAGAFYFVFNYVVAFAMRALEKKLAYYE